MSADIDAVVAALRNVAEVHVDSDTRGHITRLAPDVADYGGSTDPGSEWDEECDSRMEDVRDALPAGWSAEWSDDDVIITRDGDGDDEAAE